MSGLLELQTVMAGALLGDDPSIAGRLVRADGIAPAARIGIYRHHVETTLTDALASVYPVVRELVDPRFFSFAAARYLGESPPAGPCLFEYGASFPDFLEGFPPCRHLAFLPDVGRLEWSLHAACYAQDETPVAAASVEGVVGDIAGLLRLHLDPSLAYLSSAWPVDEIWMGHQPGGRLDAVDLGSGGVALEVRRWRDNVRFRRLAPDVFDFRRDLAGGLRLAAAASRARRRDPDFDLVAALTALFRESLVVRISLQP